MESDFFLKKKIMAPKMIPDIYGILCIGHWEGLDKGFILLMYVLKPN